jgi:DNA-binding NarL/FixJ family response regulator
MNRERILLVDDHPLVREGLQMALRLRLPGYILDAADSISAGEEMAARHKPYKLLLLDYHLPDAVGFSGFLQMRHALGSTPIAMLSADNDAQLVATARSLGAAGFLTKMQKLEDLTRDIDLLLEGKPVFHLETGVSEEVVSLGAKVQSLSRAQMRVLVALSRGDLNKQIAAELGLTEATIKAHLSAIFRKLGVVNRAQAILATRALSNQSVQ